MIRLHHKLLLIAMLALAPMSCVPATILKRNIIALGTTPRAIPARIKQPVRADVRLAALWVGHATVLIQLDDKLILTDPVLTQTVGAGFSRRLVEPGVAPEDMPSVDVAVVSHMHLDHLSLGTLEMLQGRIGQLFLPTDGLRYVPDHTFPIDEVASWQTVERDGVRITAVPVKHPGGRYGADSPWMTKSATGWVFEYNGMTVYFGGDTAYDQRIFTTVATRFPKIDLAILPIGPVEPDSFARATHVDGREALQAFLDLGATHMLPMHYDTFAHGIDPAGYAVARLRAAMQERGVTEERVHIIPIGAQYTANPAR
jgi:L-ascorbate metabolism protein UlaG (beta-lactamase superfamily)